MKLLPITYLGNVNHPHKWKDYSLLQDMNKDNNEMLEDSR